MERESSLNGNRAVKRRRDSSFNPASAPAVHLLPKQSLGVSGSAISFYDSGRFLIRSVAGIITNDDSVRLGGKPTPHLTRDETRFDQQFIEASEERRVGRRILASVRLALGDAETHTGLSISDSI